MSLLSFGNQHRSYNKAQSLQGDDRVNYLKDRLEHGTKVLVSGDSDKGAQKMVLDELKTLAFHLQQNTIDIGSRREEMLQLYNRAIGQTERTVGMVNEAATDMSGAIRENLPSFDTMMSAVSVANPAVGFGMRFLKNMTIDRRRQKKQQEQLVRQEREQLKNELELSEEQKELLEQQKSGDDPMFGGVEEKLERIYTKVKEIADVGIERIFGKDEEASVMIDGQEMSMDHLERLTDPLATEEDIENLVRAVSEQTGHLNENHEDFIEIQRVRAADNDRHELDDLEAKRKASREEDFEGKGSASSTAKEEEQGLELADMAGIGLFAGLFAKVGSLVSTIVAGLGVALRFLGPVALVVGSMVAIGQQFFDGFTNAADILGKAEEDLDLTDKISAGIGSLVGFLGDIADGLFGLFGLDTNYGDQLTRYVASGLTDALHAAQEWVGSALETTKSFFEEVTGSISGWFKSIVSGISAKVSSVVDDGIDLYEQIRLMVTDLIDTVISSARSAITNVASNIFTMDDEGAVGGVVNKIKGLIYGEDELPKDSITAEPSYPTRQLNEGVREKTMEEATKEAKEMASQNNVSVIQTNQNNQNHTHMWPSIRSGAKEPALIDTVTGSMGGVFS